ncbi:MAG: hypothetical protein JJV98_02510 [Desulfosarcina sp.]|nr:hypothetical protein [Desulfobacterales bacterium]
MELAQRIRLLAGLYTIHDHITAALDPLACRLHCDDCCTRNVTMTTLEGIYLLDGLPPDERRSLTQPVHRQADQPRYQPALTTNMLARHCIEDREPPEENHPEDDRPCPLLEARACPIYARRPFGCRCFVSRHRCGDHGYADVDAWVLTANTVFLQTIEQLDCPGCFGNFSDVLLALDDGERTGSSSLLPPECETTGLLANQPTAALMIPPAHRKKIQPVLQAIRELTATS